MITLFGSTWTTFQHALCPTSNEPLFHCSQVVDELLVAFGANQESSSDQSRRVEAAHAGTLVSRKVGSEGEVRGLDALRAAGMTVVQDVDRSALAQAARPTLDAIAHQLGEARAASIQAFQS